MSVWLFHAFLAPVAPPKSLFPARSSCLSFLSVSVSRSLHTLLLLQTPSAFSPRSLQLLPWPQSQFFLSTMVVCSTVPHRYPKPCPCPSLLLLRLQLRQAAFPAEEHQAPSTRHSVGPGVPRNMRKRSMSISSATVCAFYCDALCCPEYVPCVCRAPTQPWHPCAPATLVPLYPCIPVPMYHSVKPAAPPNMYV